MAPVFVQFDHISKNFGATKAVQDVSLKADLGSIHAVTGENGAGKSTLMKMLAGVHKPNAGQIFLGGQKVSFSSPSEALRTGVSTVFQELSLLPNLTVVENLFLGREKLRFRFALNKPQMVEDARAILHQIGLSVDPLKLVRNLPIADQQLVEIAKGISADAEVFIFDEPTAILGTEDTARVGEIIRRLKERGKLVFYISHRLQEIFDYCDFVTVLKDGKLVETAPIDDLDIDRLVRLMIGRDLEHLVPPRDQQIGEVALTVETLKLKENRDKVTFTARKGEILGVAGLEGQGAQTVVRALAGLDKVPICRFRKIGGDGEKVQVDASRGIAHVIRYGIGYVPEDRKTEGLYLDLSIKENILLGKVQKMPLWQFVPNVGEAVREMAIRMGVVAASIKQSVGSLSGGNQQKVMVGRWLFSVIDILLINDPTRGVDVGSRVEVYGVLREFTNQGGTIILSSRDMNELIALCDRILVVHDHTITAELEARGATEEMILSHAIGKTTAKTVRVK